MAEGGHYEEWQNKPKQGLNSESSSFGGASKFDGALNNEFKGALKFDGALNHREEVEGREAYGPSFGYGDLGYGNLGYGPSLANMASSLKPTGTRRGVNWKRVTATPGVAQNGQANENKLAATMPGDKDVTNSDEKTALLAAAPAPNQPKSGAPGETQKPSRSLSFVLQLPKDFKELDRNQLGYPLLILVMKQVFSLNDRDAKAEIEAGWSWKRFRIPSKEEVEKGLFEIVIDQETYNKTLERLYGISPQNQENNPATTSELIKRFKNSARQNEAVLQQTVLISLVNQIYNSQHPQNQVDRGAPLYDNPEWEAILGNLLHQQEQLKRLRDDIKRKLGGQETFDLFPEYNQEFLSIARKLNKLSREQIDSLKPLNLQGITSNGRLITRSARQDAYKQELVAYERYVEETQNIGRNAAPERPPGTASGQQTSQRDDNSQSTGNRDRGDILSQNLLRDALELRTALAQ